MKKQTILALALVLSFVLSGVVMAASVTPVEVAGWTSGDAYFECQEATTALQDLGYESDCTSDFAYKVEPWDEGDPSGSYPADGGNTIGITAYLDGDEYKTFDWTSGSNFPVNCVIVKAGTGALVYCYDGAYSDTDLSAYLDKGVSHATFCYDKVGECWEEETAWAEGERYSQRGNWAMYVDYYGVEKTVELIADYTNYVHIGTVTFSAPDANDMVTITVALDGAIFYYDVNDPLYDDNLKVQDYGSAPHGNPKIGKFDWKTRIEPGSTTGSIVVPNNSFYGVHLDVALPCD